MKKWLRNLLLIVGLGMFGYFIYQAGIEQIRAAFIGETWTDLNVNGVCGMRENRLWMPPGTTGMTKA